MYIRETSCSMGPGRRQEKSRTALGRGISEGVRLNNDQIIVPRWAGAHTPKE
jgi:electron transfer flavoprotein alpha/beta subunit